MGSGLEVTQKDHLVLLLNHQPATACRRDSGQVQPELEGRGLAAMEHWRPSSPGLSFPPCSTVRKKEVGGASCNPAPAAPSSDSKTARRGDPGRVTTSWSLVPTCTMRKKLSPHLREFCVNLSVAPTGRLPEPCSRITNSSPPVATRLRLKLFSPRCSYQPTFLSQLPAPGKRLHLTSRPSPCAHFSTSSLAPLRDSGV